jgi:hypothetical protein
MARFLFPSTCQFGASGHGSVENRPKNASPRDRRNSAGPVPISPVEIDTDLVDLELIPYGNTRLRISEFPTLKQ